MSKIVHITWLNPNQNVDLYPAVLEGMKIELRLSRPTGEYFFVATAEDAQTLKTRMERHIPKRHYTLVDDENRPIQLVSEPEIIILDFP